MNTQTSYQQLVQQINKQVEELAQQTDQARMSADMLRYLDAISRFHRYSLYNTWLILMNRPDATHVCGFRQWNSFNRFVKRGEIGIPILAPIFIKKQENKRPEDNKLVLRGFKVCYVFDISQTDGQELPPPPDWKKPEQNSFLNERLMAFAHERGITVTEKALDGETQGVSMGGSIEIAPSAGTSTMVHEIAHEIMLHHGSELPASIKELEAEATAYVVCRHFALDPKNAPNYIALQQGVTSDLIMQHMERIRVTAMKIIQYAEGTEIANLPRKEIQAQTYPSCNAKAPEF